MSEQAVVEQIKRLWPGLGDHAGYVLWNHTCFPLCDPNAVDETEEGNLAHWLRQVEDYVKASAEEWQHRHG